MSKALDLIGKTSTIETEMMVLLSEKLAVKMQQVANQEAEDEEAVNAGLSEGGRTLPQIWEFVYEKASKIASKSIKKDSGAPTHLQNDWRNGEGASALCELVAKYAKSFNQAFEQGGLKAVEALAVSSLRNEFIAFCKVEQSAGVVKKTLKTQSVVSAFSRDDGKEYAKMDKLQKSEAVGQALKFFDAVSIHPSDDDEDSRGIELVSGFDDPLAELIGQENQKEESEKLTFEKIARFIMSNPARYPVLFDAFSLSTGLMFKYSERDIVRDAAKLGEDLCIDFDQLELVKAFQTFKVLEGGLKINTIENKLGIIDTAPIFEAIKSGELTREEVAKDRREAFMNYAEINELVNGFHAGETVFFSIENLIDAAIMQIAEGRNDNEDLAVIADLLCADPDPCRADDKAFQKAKRDAMTQLFGSAPQEYDLPPMPPVVQLGEQVSLF